MFKKHIYSLKKNSNEKKENMTKARQSKERGLSQTKI